MEEIAACARSGARGAARPQFPHACMDGKMMKFNSTLGMITTVAAFALGSDALGTDRLVPKQYATIQLAIDASQDGDSVLVAPGSYAPFDMGDLQIAVASVAGAATTTIDAGGMATSAVRFGENATFASTLRAFTIRTGSGSLIWDGWRAGGGCFIHRGAATRSSLAATIEDCEFIGSSGGGGYGAGIWARDCNIAIRRCRFTDVHTQHHGPAIAFEVAPGDILPGELGFQSIIEDCFFGPSSSYNNGGLQIGMNSPIADCRVRVSPCEFAGNSGYYQAGAILTGGAAGSAAHELVVEQCVFRSNSASLTNAIGVALIGNNNPLFKLTLRDSVFADPGTSVRLGTGQLTLENNFFCSGNGAISGAFTDLGGNVFSCPAVTDCDLDGVDDFYATVLGLVADANANNVPDSCEGFLDVPGQYATIQAAIDAVPSGENGIIRVAAGTYNESFALNGKDVVVFGAPNGETILDGEGLTSSIATFSGGEPVTAALENLVFKNATTGTPATILNPKAKYHIGGAIFARDAFVNLRSCRFENCHTDFGGAVYVFYTTFHAEDCTFTGNAANDDGGAIMSFRSSGGVYASTFEDNRCGLSSTSSGSAIKLVGAREADGLFEIEGCTITGAPVNNFGAAVQQFEDTSGVPGVLHIKATTITNNTSGDGASGLRVAGRMQSCVLSDGTEICNNAPSNVSGPFVIDGNVVVCDCLADLSGDGQVNGFDLSHVLSGWGLTNAQGTGDVNHDGVVNGEDLAVLLSAWGSCE